jgi:hypothetical protein
MTIPEAAIIVAKLKGAGYSDRKADDVAARLASIDPSLHAGVTEWVMNDRIVDMSVADYSLRSLIQTQNMKPPAAFLTLDWLVRDPATASAAIRAGHDRVLRRSRG